MKQFDLIKFLMTVMGAGVSMVVFSYSTFATKEYVKETIVERLDRIENKLDKILEEKR